MKNNEFELEINASGQLFYLRDGKKVKVSIKRCFPWSHPAQYFSLQDRENKELALVESVESLNESSGKSLMASLMEAGFCFNITDIVEVKEDFELRNWVVETEQGKRSFQTKLMDWPREVPRNGLLIQDVFGDIYFISNIDKLPQAGKSILWAYMD